MLMPRAYKREARGVGSGAGGGGLRSQMGCWRLKLVLYPVGVQSCAGEGRGGHNELQGEKAIGLKVGLAACVPGRMAISVGHVLG